MANLVVGIDAANLLGGGGRTHLIELLRAAKPYKYGVHRVVVWAAKETLQQIEDREWIDKRCPSQLNKGTVSRAIWQRFRLSKEAFREECDVLFIPGGSFAGNFRPTVVMSRNMLPFEWSELIQYGWSLMTFRLVLLRKIQARSFRRADGVIFLSDYARTNVQKVTGQLSGSTATIPHGLNRRFLRPPKAQYPIDQYTKEQPFRILYVSTVDCYKHQWVVVEAVGQLRANTRWPVKLDLVGPGRKSSVSRLHQSMNLWDKEREWVNYHGAIHYDELHKAYQRADLGIFASSCENMPNILLENMASGLPIASSNRGPMPEILRNAGSYFDPTDPTSIKESLEKLIKSTALRESFASLSYECAHEFSWEQCSEATLKFLFNASRGFLTGKA